MLSIQQTHAEQARVALLGSYVPRRCGIATFTFDLGTALCRTGASVDIFAVVDECEFEYGPEVVHEIPEDDLEAYRTAAKAVMAGGYDALLVQHEFGIFGGEAGDHLLTLLNLVSIPVITTFHTVLTEPNDSQMRVMKSLLERSDRVVVMSHRAVQILRETYHADPRRIDMIPHGIPDFAMAAPREELVALPSTAPLLMTFGLLSPDKGIQFVIEAMPEILQTAPHAHYLVLGATHPHIRRNSGEAYRESLVALAESLGVKDHVTFVDEYATLPQILGYLQAADVYLTPYLNRQQITSGTLAYALGAGKPIVSTRYWHAEELLAEGRGQLVPFRDSAAIAEAVTEVIVDTGRRDSIQAKALAYAADMSWQAVAESYARAVLESRPLKAAVRLAAVQTLPTRSELASTPALSLDQLLRLTDDTGILQHARFNIPRRLDGYCVDDNARALALTIGLETAIPQSATVGRLQDVYMSFVEHAFNEESRRFRNFMSFDRQWLEEFGSEDSHARTVWALATVTYRARGEGTRRLARELLGRSMPAMASFSSPRAWAFGILACDEWMEAEPGHDEPITMLRHLAGRLQQRYADAALPHWPWFERNLSYGNARLSEAAITAGERLPSTGLSEIGLSSLEWLMALQAPDGGVFIPIGTEGVKSEDHRRSIYDQQPLEAWDSISACLTAARFSGNREWAARARKAFAWFHGENTEGLALGSPETGGCADGLHKGRVNENQGAESTLAYLHSILEMRHVEAELGLDQPTVRPSL